MAEAVFSLFFSYANSKLNEYCVTELQDSIFQQKSVW